MVNEAKGSALGTNGGSDNFAHSRDTTILPTRMISTGAISLALGAIDGRVSPKRRAGGAAMCALVVTSSGQPHFTLETQGGFDATTMKTAFLCGTECGDLRPIALGSNR